ncbi:transglutaminase family protein [uncultured Jatrophihabitans sp.]|uniref:transglutaminase-like domain-containing protein n=1 Tax=uncultured Jatrophihabitans sp. TaxID=1610747 RepID=UPI0035CA70ED
MTLVRTVSAELQLAVQGPCRLALQLAVADPAAHRAEEDISLTLNGARQSWREVAAPAAGRLWIVDAQPGDLLLTYRAELPATAPPPEYDVADELLYLRPSRYCEADRLIGFAARLFHDITEPADVLAAVSSWVGTQLDYVSGSSGPTDGAVETLLAGRGVCRDFAHLAVALLRAKGVPARLVAVYAPGLEPMDFHAVAEALIDDTWHVIDATLLAPRASLVRIATGRDAADTAFLSNYGASIELQKLTVTATVAGDLPTDDVTALVQLA